MKPARSEKLSRTAEEKYYRDFYRWLERVDGEKPKESRETLQQLANPKVSDSRAREDVSDSVTSDLVSLCVASLDRELRAFAVNLGEQQVGRDKAKALLAKRAKELLAITHDKKWSFGLRLLESLWSSSWHPFRRSLGLRDDLWNIVETSVDGLEREWLLDIEDGRYAPRKGETRNDLVVRFKTRLAEAGYRIANEHLWRAVKHGQPRQFYYWKSGEDRQPGQKRGATREDDRNFRRIRRLGEREPTGRPTLLQRSRPIHRP